MAKGTKGGTVYVELSLDRDQFDKDFKRIGREVTAEQKRLSLEMERNKIKFAVEGMEKGWADKLFGGSVIGKIQNARKETNFLNEQIDAQKTKVNLARNAWASLFSHKGAGSAATISAERTYMREQMALVGLKNQLDGTASASAVMGSSLVTAATVGVAAVTALAAAYASAVSAATAWGQAVNDIADETGLADEEAATLLGTMRFVGLSSEEAAGSIAKMSRTVSAAAAAQTVANDAGKKSDDVFTKYGIAIKDADGALLSHSEILANITTVHRSMSDGLTKTAMEMDIFGKSGYKLNDLLNMTSERSKEVADTLSRLGLSTGLNSQKFEDLTQQLNLAKMGLQSIANTITGDDIGAITDLIKKFTELAVWIRENKKVIDELAAVVGTALTPFKPFVAVLDTVIGKLKELAEARSKYLKDNDPKTQLAQPTADDFAKQDKTIEENRKKNNQVLLDKLKANQDMIDKTQELNNAVAALNGQALAVQLANIEKEKKAWEAKGLAEADIAKWVAAARVKANKDAQDRIDASLKSYESALEKIKSAREAVTGAFQGAFGSAINQVYENLKKGQSANAYDAVRQMRQEYEMRRQAMRSVAAEVGMKDIPDPLTPEEQVQKAFEALSKAMTESDVEKIKYLKIIADNTAKGNGGGGSGDGKKNDNANQSPPQPTYNPGYQYGQMDAQGNIQPINITVPVSIDGQQVGQAAAKVILPAVQNAVGGNPTAFGGNQ